MEDRVELSRAVMRLTGERHAEALSEILVQFPNALSWRDYPGESLLHLWVEKNDAAAVKMLLDLGADLYAVDDAGMSTLAVCAESGSLEMAQLLLNRGADPNWGASCAPPIFHSIGRRRTDLTELLLRNHANPNVRDDCDEWALFVAIAMDDFSTAKLLLEHGADPNVDDAGGDSLHYVIYAEMEVEAIKYYRLLSEFGADLLRLDANLNHPIFLANKDNDQEVVDYFLGKGMEVPNWRPGLPNGGVLDV